jgi:PIN domain nuclease of toxin-antitoxin system
MQVEPERLSDEALDRIRDSETDLVLSAASSWEIAIKYALGRLPLPVPPAEYVPDRIETSGVSPLPVEHAHALWVAGLPSHHRDPFDRLLIAQAQIEELAILTADRQFEPYDVEILWAA